MIKHARAPRPRRPRVQVDKDVRVQSRAGQGTADLVRPPTRLTRAALLAGAALPSNPGVGRTLRPLCLHLQCGPLPFAS